MSLHDTKKYNYIFILKMYACSCSYWVMYFDPLLFRVTWKVLTQKNHHTRVIRVLYFECFAFCFLTWTKFLNPKYPDPSKLVILRTQTPPYRFKPCHWRVQWSFWNSKLPYWWVYRPFLPIVSSEEVFQKILLTLNHMVMILGRKYIQAYLRTHLVHFHANHWCIHGQQSLCPKAF